eukprot:CAMPEP_0117430766 /NCGR_PEP_ID=MMETSP0758-20121206/10319_1 /TAXON_ID=63605 /ORGANISM="Percolomonas cosmopolitus, Strain AE-1 (ATCC 50343)" /LENGTH=368 /DNA_ID=CAMNT_0005219141 /DNA_START=89 /DNA_END=1192 /DNA_ORIENTATION=+
MMEEMTNEEQIGRLFYETWRVQLSSIQCTMVRKYKYEKQQERREAAERRSTTISKFSAKYKKKMKEKEVIPYTNHVVKGIMKTMIARYRYKKQQRAATRIQRWYKRKRETRVERKMYYIQRMIAKRVTIPQNQIRQQLTQHRYNSIKEHIVTLQSRIRTTQQLEKERERQLEKTARLLQRLIRQQLDQHKVNELIEEQHIIRVQSLIRKQLEIQKIKEQKQMVDEEEDEQQVNKRHNQRLVHKVMVLYELLNVSYIRRALFIFHVKHETIEKATALIEQELHFYSKVHEFAMTDTLYDQHLQFIFERLEVQKDHQEIAGLLWHAYKPQLILSKKSLKKKKKPLTRKRSIAFLKKKGSSMFKKLATFKR